MKPIRLSMTAFGPYRDLEVIDFTQLKEQQLFVISGPTGAGKTTIFDAICFALYGQASGEDRSDISALRSDFADDSIPTTVELIFEIHQRRFRVLRQIPYVKSGNKSKTLAKHELFELTEEGEIPYVDRQMVTEINRKIVELIGLTQVQFSQIVMLPQGEFRKFLTSDTENKETILRKIFNTDTFQEIVHRLKDRKDFTQQQLFQETERMDSWVKQISSRLPHRSSPLFEALFVEVPNIYHVVEGLQNERAYYEQKMKQDELEYEKAVQRHEHLLSQYHAAKAVNEKWLELEQLQIEKNKLDDERKEMTVYEQRLLAAERAVSLEEIELRLLESRTLLEQKLISHEKMTINLQKANKQLEQATIQYEEEVANASIRQNLIEQLIVLKGYLPAVAHFHEKEQTLLSLQHELQKLERQWLTKEQEHEKAVRQFQETQQSFEQLDEQATRYEAVMEQWNIINEQFKKMSLKQQLAEQLIDIERQMKGLQANYLQQQKETEQMEMEWFSNQAIQLAHSLQDGQPCPVCGSKEHPAPTIKANTSFFTKVQVDEAKAKLANSEVAYRTIIAKQQAVQEQYEAIVEEMTQLGISLSAEELEEQLHTITEEVNQLRSIREQLPEHKQRVVKQREIVESLQHQRLDAERASLKVKGTYDREAAVLNNIVTSVPETYRILANLQFTIQEMESKKQQLEQQWEQARLAFETAKEQVAVLTSTELHAATAVTEGRQHVESIEQRFHSALVDAGFEDEQAFVDARLELDERQKMKNVLMSYNNRLHLVKERMLRLASQLEGKTMTDLEAIEKEISELKVVYEEAYVQFMQSKEYVQIIHTIVQELTVGMKKTKQLEVTVGKITNLYEVLRGQNEEKLSFERYIQLEYLEHIIHAANERLREMSNGQFELVRSDRKESHGRQSGLGLDVYDAYTGMNRDVKTLSGGEKFNASLSLALGMADVIQSFQGSVSIDTMFIDEGFGSLDEESLMKAIDALIVLQRSGRMIGVISHVEELKAALPARLEVTKTKEGYSETKFVIS